MDNGNGKGSGLIKTLESDSQYDIKWGSGDTVSGRPMKRKAAASNKKERMRRLRIVLGFIAFVLVFSYLFIIRPAQAIRSDLKTVETKGRELKAAFESNDMDLVEKKYQEFTASYKELEKDSKNIYWLSFIPYVSDYKNGIEAGNYMIIAGKQSLEAIKPYADLIGFKKGETGFSEKSGEDRLQTAILTLDKVLVNLDDISKNMEEAQKRIDKIDPNRYPEKVGNTFVKGRIENIKEQFHAVSSLFVDAKPLLKQLPVILGKDKDKTYLILFQNNYERRATGGFLTSYAYFKIRDGKIEIQRSSDIYSLDQAISNHPPAPREIREFHKNVNQFYIRDSNLSPDLPTSIKYFQDLYERSGGKQDYDGIVLMDAKVLVDFLTIYGDTEAQGVMFSAKEDARCDCPQVIYTLFDLVDRPVNYIKTDRKGVLGDLMLNLFQKALGFSPSQYWPILAQTMYQNLEEKHIQLYFKDTNLQQATEAIDFAGRIMPFDGDYLHINNVNFAGAKSNLFVTEDIESKTTEKDGKIQKEVIITFRNPYPHSDCNLERGGLCLNATLRNWIRFYVPEGSQLISLKGAARKTSTYNELGKTVYENFLTVSPQGRAQVTLTYTLPDRIKKSNYKYMVQKQGSVQKERQTLEVIVGGRQLYKGQFDTDKVFDQNF